jgi:hypothetical protein
MADDKTNRGGQDRTRIDTNQDHEMRYWCETLGVSPGHLRQAVTAVGDRVDKVRAYLGRGGTAGAKRTGA